LTPVKAKHVANMPKMSYTDIAQNMQSNGGHLNSWLWQSTPCI